MFISYNFEKRRKNNVLNMPIMHHPTPRNTCPSPNPYPNPLLCSFPLVSIIRRPNISIIIPTTPFGHDYHPTSINAYLKDYAGFAPVSMMGRLYIY
jgi:hypothetical protein